MSKRYNKNQMTRNNEITNIKTSIWMSTFLEMVICVFIVSCFLVIWLLPIVTNKVDNLPDIGVSDYRKGCQPLTRIIYVRGRYSLLVVTGNRRSMRCFSASISFRASSSSLRSAFTSSVDAVFVLAVLCISLRRTTPLLSTVR